MDAGDRTVPGPDLLHGRKVARREGPIEGLVREQDGIMIHGSGPGRANAAQTGATDGTRTHNPRDHNPVL